MLKQTWYPSNRLFPTDDLYKSFVEGHCNVILHERPYVSERVFRMRVRKYNYNGTYSIAKTLFSKEPLAIVTRDDDPQWSNFCDWVIQVLLVADKYSITKETVVVAEGTVSSWLSTRMISLKDQVDEDRFVNIIKAVGNYGEIYNEYLQDIIPRLGSDLINTRGDTGLVYSFPLGATFRDDHPGPGPVESGYLARILDRGYLICGIIQRKSMFNKEQQLSWNSNMDADFCRGLSASIFDGNSSAIEFVAVLAIDTDSGDDAFKALSNGTLDVLAGANITLGVSDTGDVPHESFSFSPAYFYPDHDLPP